MVKNMKKKLQVSKVKTEGLTSTSTKSNNKVGNPITKKKNKNKKKMVVGNANDVVKDRTQQKKNKNANTNKLQASTSDESKKEKMSKKKLSKEKRKLDSDIKSDVKEKSVKNEDEDIILPKKKKLGSQREVKVKKKHKHVPLNKPFQQKIDSFPPSKIVKSFTSSKFSSSSSGHNSKQKSELPRLKVSSGFSWDDEFTLPTSSTNKDKDSSSDDSDSEEDKKVEKSRAEIRLEKIAEEKKIYEYEKKRLEGKEELETADDFDRLVLQSPDSSLVWTRYMAYHLECTEIDKARAVAERALNTISFRDEQEKLNIWVAYLNLENMYGTLDQQEELFERAKKFCDFKKIHERMISIYVRSEKYEEAEELYEILVKKFSGEKQIWLNYVQFCFRNNRFDNGRKLLQRCFKCLEKKEHIEMISKVAQMEIKFGDGERGRTMYENLVTNYPKRLDLWSVYIDMIRILGDLDGTRKLFERVLSLKMNAKRMKFIFKKYLDFENKYGSPDRVAAIKEKALKYVETKGYYEDE